jgi:ArsR family metal-binding transcriptional regulator
MPGAMGVLCYAHLDQDVSAALPYLNAELGGFEYIADPPSVTFRSQGKIITVYGRKIAVNAISDAAEAEKIVQWLQREINHAWENRHRITPTTESLARPQVIDILKMLPRTNCRKCGAATCMVFAAWAAEGGKGAADCPELSAAMQAELDTNLSKFFPEDYEL